MNSVRVLLVISIALLSSASAQAQVVREEGVKSIAGVLGGAYPTEARWTVMSAGGEVIFASLDAEIYQTLEHGEEFLAGATAADGGGCGEDEGGCGEDEGGCKGGDPGRFCLQVIDPAGLVICQATRPAPPPGWQRDPRLACVLPASVGRAVYSIRVSLTGTGGACTQSPQTVAAESEYPFLLNVSVRRISPSGVSIQQAVAQSANRFR